MYIHTHTHTRTYTHKHMRIYIYYIFISIYSHIYVYWYIYIYRIYQAWYEMTVRQTICSFSRPVSRPASRAGELGSIPSSVINSTRMYRVATWVVSSFGSGVQNSSNKWVRRPSVGHPGKWYVDQVWSSRLRRSVQTGCGQKRTQDKNVLMQEKVSREQKRMARKNPTRYSTMVGCCLWQNWESNPVRRPEGPED